MPLFSREVASGNPAAEVCSADLHRMVVAYDAISETIVAQHSSRCSLQP